MFCESYDQQLRDFDSLHHKFQLGEGMLVKWNLRKVQVNEKIGRGGERKHLPLPVHCTPPNGQCVCVVICENFGLDPRVWCVVFEQTLDRCLGLFADSYKTPEYSAWLGLASPYWLFSGIYLLSHPHRSLDVFFNHFIHCGLTTRDQESNAHAYTLDWCAFE